MRSLIRRGVIFSALISLTACATLPPEHHLDAGARQHIKTVDAVLIAKQDEIGADIKQNGVLTEISALLSGTTIIPVLLEVGVAGVRTISANKMAKPMREALEDHDYPWEFREQVRQSLEGTTLDGVDNFKIVRAEYPGLRGQIITTSDADAVLLVDMKYAFTPSFEKLYVASAAMLFPKTPELAQFQETPDKDNILEVSDNIYRNQYAVQISTGLTDATKAEHAAKWAEMSEEQLIEVLDVAGLLLADTIANDIEIDDVDSDLDLIPEGYVLNTKYGNLNQKHAAKQTLETVLETPPDARAAPTPVPDLEPEPEPEPENTSETESEINAAIVN